MNIQTLFPASKSALMLALAAAVLRSAPVQAQAVPTYGADWEVVAGGGGTSTGGVFSVSGTLGQPDAGLAMSGGIYSLSGGFWALFAVQTPEAPMLKILLTATNTALVSWPAPAPGFSLQQNTSLNPANWLAPAETINSNGSTKFIIVNPPAGQRFYRLKN